MRRVAILGVFLAAALPSLAAPCGGHGTRATMLVTAKWLADHLSDPNLVILAVGQKSEYDAGHIPGAQFVAFNSIALPPSADRANSAELPPMADLAKAFAALGISNDSRIVLYMTKDAIAPTTRVYLTLDAMGLGPQASLLDGGFPEWQRGGHPVTTDVRAPKAGKIEPCAQNDVITDVNYVKSNLRKPGVGIVDARTNNFYTGETPGRNMRPGRIPGAVSVPYLTLLDDTGKFRSPEVMAKQFEDAGIKKGDRIVSYCHIGQQATVVYFAARYLGYDARMYDGSFEEWSRMSELPVEK